MCPVCENSACHALHLPTAPVATAPTTSTKMFSKDDPGASLEMLTLHASGVQTRELSEGGSRETIKAEPVACAVLRGGSGDRGDLV